MDYCMDRINLKYLFLMMLIACSKQEYKPSEAKLKYLNSLNDKDRMYIEACMGQGQDGMFDYCVINLREMELCRDRRR